HQVKIIYSRRPETPRDLSAFFDSDISLVQIQMLSIADKIGSVPRLRQELVSMRPEAVFMHSSFSGFLGRVSTVLALKDTSMFYIPHCISFMRKDISVLQRVSFVFLEWIGAIKN